MPAKPWLNAIDIRAEQEAKKNLLPETVLNPQPQAGQGPYGKVPGPITYPTTPYAEATRIYPGLANLTPQAGEEIRSQIAGEFTPMEENALWDISNRFGVQSGMPGAQLWSNRFMGNRIEEGIKRRQQGVENYNMLLANLSKMGVDPALAAEIAARNANMAAAPDPEAAAKALEAAYRNAMNPAAGTLQSPLGTNTYGQGFRSPGFSPWPQGGTTAPRYGGVPGPVTTPTNPYATAEQSRRTEDDIINAWLDQIAPEVWPTIPGQTPVDDSWFDPGYANQEVNTQDWWFDPGYSNAEAGDDEWWFYEE